MKLSKTLILLILICLSFQSYGQNTHFSKVKISLDQRDIIELASLGLDVEHGNFRAGEFFIGDFADSEIDQIQAAGFSYDILIEDVIAHYVEQNKGAAVFPPDVLKSGQDCQTGVYDYEVPVNFELGSMGGFFTYQEMLDNLDAMAAAYPNLISARQPIGEILTHEGRPIYWLRLSDNANTDEEEPEILYDALHHAREPNSLSQLIYYMWFLLENYETNPEVQYLVDNVEMYFVPMVNPDGYIYNETSSPNGGYLWRKNKRDNDENGIFEEDVDGVDLNRNYGYNWAFDNSGSSPNFGSQVYRGPEAFSEPETQNMRDFCNAHDFKIALNYHTYGNLLIYPWSHSDELADPGFRDLAHILNVENNYRAGTGSETVGYPVNGDANDWMYGEMVTKPAIYTFIPEVGPTNYGFWPPSTEIINLSQSAFLQNILAAHLVLNYGEVSDESPDILENLDGQIDFNFKRFGLSDGPMTVTLIGLSGEIIAVGAAKTFDLNAFEDMDDAINYTLAASTLGGTPLEFKFTLDNGMYTWEQTITKIYGEGTSVYSNDGTAISEWTVGPGGDWGLTVNDFISAPVSTADSPIGNYQNNSQSYLTLDDPISLLDAEAASLKFWCKWDIEENRDYAQVLISTDGDNFTPLCGKYTEPGAVFQDYHQPLYDGLQEEWVLEEIDLSDYVGQDIWIQFKMAADNNFQTADGYYFDDLEVTVVYEEVLNTIPLEANDFGMYQNRPNPADEYTVIEFKQDQVDLSDASLLVFNALGQIVFQQKIDAGSGGSVVLDTHDWEVGFYFYQLMIGGERTPSMRMSVAR